MKKVLLLISLIWIGIQMQAQCDFMVQDQTMCYGNMITFPQVSGAQLYDANKQLIDPNGPQPTVLPNPGTYQYYLKGDNCDNYIPFTITIIGVVQPIVEDIIISQGTVGVLTVQNANSANNVKWYKNGVLVSTSIALEVQGLVVGVTDYYVSLTTLEGCESEQVKATVTVVGNDCASSTPIPLQTQYIVNYNDPMPALTVADATPDIPGNIIWTMSPIQTTVLASGLSYTPTNSTTFPATYIYYASKQIEGCMSPVAEITVTVLGCNVPNPEPEFLEYSSVVNEPTKTLQLKNELTDVYKITWYVDSLDNAQFEYVSNSFIPPFTKSGIYFISVVITNNEMECNSSWVTIIYNVLPCMSAPTALSNVETSMYLHEAAPVFKTAESCVWYDENENKIGEGTEYSPSVFKTGYFRFSARQESESCKGEILTFWLNVQSYSISGRVYCDKNENLSYDLNGDKPISKTQVYIKECNKYVSTDNDGLFTFQTDTFGIYTLSVAGLDDKFTVLGTETQVVSINYGNPSVYDVNMPFKVDQNNDLSVSIVAISNLAVGRNVGYQVMVKNEGAAQSNIQVSITYPDSLIIYSGSTSSEQESGNTLSYTLETLGEFQEDVRYVYFTVVPDWTITGDTVSLKIDATSGVTDVFPDDNIDSTFNIIRNSMDPNDKAVSPSVHDKGYVLLNTELTYTIRFQNKGTGEAWDINIKDTIDFKMDISTFQLISSSHDLIYTIDNNVVTFSFPNIMLPCESDDEPGSNGFVKYSVQPLSTIDYSVLPVEVKNTAYIYFDFNPAVVTNTTISSYVDKIPTVKSPTKLNETAIEKLVISPNPASDMANVLTSLKGNKELSIIDSKGICVKTLSFNSDLVSISVSDLATGIYKIYIRNDKQIESGTLIVR